MHTANDTAGDGVERAVSRGRAWTVLGVGLGLLVVLGVMVVPIAWLIGLLQLQVTCARTEVLACEAFGTNVVTFAPAAGLLIGLAVGVVLGYLAMRRGRLPVIAVLAAWGIFGASLLSVLVVANAGPTAEQRAQQLAEQQAADAQWLAEVSGRVDFEVALARHREMQQRIALELPKAVPGQDWPVLVKRSTCARRQLAAAEQIQDYYSTLRAPKSDAQWIALDATVRRVAGEYGFTGPPLRLNPARSPTQFELRASDQSGGGAILSVHAEGRGRLSVSFSTACHLPAAERARLASIPAGAPSVPPTR